MIPIHHASVPRVEATVGVDAAAATRWQCAIVGGGPAGAAAALRLAGRGLTVILIDAGPMPRPKVCGCCLSPAAMHELQRLAEVAGSVPPEVARACPLDLVTLAADGRRARIAMRGGAALSRASLDSALVRGAIAAGAAWLPETRVNSVGEDADGAVIQARCGPQGLALHADLVVLAHGLGSSVRVPGSGGKAARGTSRVGIGAILPPDACGLPPGELAMAVARGGYCGLVRLEDGRLDLAAAVDPSLLAAAASPAALLSAIIDSACGATVGRDIVAAVNSASIRGTPALTHAAGPLAGGRGRILRIGDAAGYVEPFTGEGIGWALAGARTLDEVIGVLGCERLGDVGAAYAPAYRRRFAADHARCRSVARAVRTPLLVRCVATAARALPGIAAGMLPLVAGAAPTGKVAA